MQFAYEVIKIPVGGPLDFEPVIFFNFLWSTIIIYFICGHQNPKEAKKTPVKEDKKSVGKDEKKTASKEENKTLKEKLVKVDKKTKKSASGATSPVSVDIDVDGSDEFVILEDEVRCS